MIGPWPVRSGFLAAIVGSGLLTSGVASAATLLGFWNFTELSGTLAHDSSGNGKNGTLNGDAVFDPGFGPAGGGAVSLTSTGFVSMGNNFAFSGTTSFS